ncbi:uncharacterized protein LOC135119421 isoform X3 [Zophobas morio]|uniref:uncharacterized protein LOC135119421 isoform X3 n=1 Tax=Zophobas morio TaxID=2755281 RepID=UPI0030833565
MEDKKIRIEKLEEAVKNFILDISKMELTLENLPAELSSLIYIDEGQSSDAFFRDHLLQTMQGCRVAKGRVEAFEKFQESLQSEVNIQFPLLLEAYQQSEAIFTQTREQQ